jgi:hypothetical protein
LNDFLDRPAALHEKGSVCTSAFLLFFFVLFLAPSFPAAASIRTCASKQVLPFE